MLSDLALQSLKPTGKQYIVWDVPNFGVRVSQSGTKAFIAQLGNDRRKVTIGRYPDMSLKDARKKAQKLLLSDEPTQESVMLATALDAYRDSAVAFVTAWLDREAISKKWQRAEIKAQQLTLDL